MPWRRLLYGGLAVHAISWLSPVYESASGATKLIGAQAYWTTCTAFPESVDFGQILMSISPHTNYLVLLAVWAHLRWNSVSKQRAVSLALVAALAINTVWYFLDSSPSELRFGYYLWLISFATIALSFLGGAPRSAILLPTAGDRS